MGDRGPQARSSDEDHAPAFDGESASFLDETKAASGGRAQEATQFVETVGRDREPITALTWRDAARELNDRGIENFRLVRGHDAESFLFVCTLVPGDNPHVTMQFEAEANEPLAAVSDVLNQVEVWLRNRFAAPPPSATGRDEVP
jgi:hypothetical protein